MSSIVSRQRAAVATGLRSFLRVPANLALVVVLPPVVILAFELALDSFADVPGMTVDAAAAAEGGTLFATAFLAGLLGIFQVVDTADADDRLVVAGYRPVEVLTARLLTVLLAGTFVAGITYGTYRVRVDAAPEAPALAIGAVLVAAIIYGLIGAIIGALVGRELEGSLVLVFLADFDAFAAIEAVPVEGDVVDYTPLARPHALFTSALHDGTVETGDALVAGAYVVALAAVALVVVTVRGGGS